jgi:hypothetical protein
MDWIGLDSPNSLFSGLIYVLLYSPLPFCFVSIVTISLSLQLRNLSGQAPQAVNDRHGAVYRVSSGHPIVDCCCRRRWFIVYVSFGLSFTFGLVVGDVFVLYLQFAGFVILLTRTFTLFRIATTLFTYCTEETCMRGYRIPNSRRRTLPNR